MRALTAFLCLALSMAVPVHSRDTLNYSNTRHGTVFYHAPDIDMHAARFSPARAGELTGVQLRFDGGGPGSTARLRIFGTEGGRALPALERDLTAPLILEKQGAGIETLTVEFPEGIPIRGAQFFIAVDELSPGLLLLSDRVARTPDCTGEHGEAYGRQLIRRGGHWQRGEYAWCIAAIMRYPQEEPGSGFRDVTALMELDSNLSMRSIAWADVNRDSWLDLLCPEGLYLNEGGLRFRAAALPEAPGASRSVQFFIDLDGDGWSDILRLGEGIACTAFINNGEGSFSAREIALPALRSVTAFSTGDINGDGHCDIFIAQAEGAQALPNLLLLADGRGGFRVANMPHTVPAATYGCAMVDVDSDGDLDLYVANYAPQDDELWYNNGGSLTPGGVPARARALGCAWRDYDNDGRPDLALPHFAAADEVDANPYAASLLLRNTAEAGFIAQAAGSDEALPDWQERPSGAAWGDVDNDALPDLFLPTGCRCSYAELYMQEGGAFRQRTGEYSLGSLADGRDALFVDVNNDGRLDLLTGSAGRLRLLLNESALAGNYIQIESAENTGRPLAPGTRVSIYAGGRCYTQESATGQGRCMQGPARLHFGLGTAEQIDSVLVRAPGAPQGTRLAGNIALNSLHQPGAGHPGAEAAGLLAAVEIYPNPFTSRLGISYSLTEDSAVRVAIFDALGRRVAQLQDGPQSAGRYTLHWDAADPNGLRAAPGSYLVRISSDKDEYTESLTLID